MIRKPEATMPCKTCPVCVHPERKTIDRTLEIGQSPQSIVRRYASLGRKALHKHREEGHHDQERAA
jgi:hypothetical protein